MGNTCTPVADSCQCMAKPLQYCKVISLQLKWINLWKNKIKAAWHRWVSRLTTWAPCHHVHLQWSCACPEPGCNVHKAVGVRVHVCPPHPAVGEAGKEWDNLLWRFGSPSWQGTVLCVMAAQYSQGDQYLPCKMTDPRVMWFPWWQDSSHGKTAKALLCRVIDKNLSYKKQSQPWQ